jgi:hypothetical protein
MSQGDYAINGIPVFVNEIGFKITSPVRIKTA